MRTQRLRGLVLAAMLAAGCGGLQSCATNHLLEWSEGKPSIFSQPSEENRSYVHPAGLVLGLPITVTWDVVTFPFQFLWDVFPYGSEMRPEDDVSPTGEPGN